MVSLVAISIAFLTTSITGIHLYREKKGKLLMMFTIIGILLFITSWAFKILQLPGSNQLLLASVIILLILFPALTLYFNSNLKSENNILTYLHQKHIPGIERFLIFLLGLAVILRISSIVFGYPPNVSGALLILVICSAGLQYFALTWHPQTTNYVGTNIWRQVLLIITFACFIIPALGSYLSLPIRVTLGTVFFVIAGILAVERLPKNSKRIYLTILFGFILFFQISLWFIQMNFIHVANQSFLFNIPGLLIIVGGIIFSEKHSLFRTYMIIVLAHYLLEYPANLSLW